MVETAGGIEDISQTRIPPAATPNMSALSVPLPDAEPALDATLAAAAEPVLAAPSPIPTPLADEPPVSQRKPPAIYSQPPDSELESADAGWFSFQIESSAQPPAIEEADEVTAVAVVPIPPAARPEPEAEATPVPDKPHVPRADDPLRKTLTSSSAPPAADDEAAPGTSVPVERGHRPPLRSDTLGSAGNEAAAAQAAIAAEPVKSPPRPAVKVPRPISPVAPAVIEDDGLAQALSDETPAPAPVLAVAPVAIIDPTPAPAVAPAPVPKVEPPAAPKPAPGTFGQTLPLAAMTPPALADAKLDAVLGQTLPLEASPKTRSSRPPEARPIDVRSPSSRPGAKRSSDASTQPPQAAPRVLSGSSKAPTRAAPKSPTPPAPEVNDGGWLRTAVLALLAAGASYFGVTKLFSAPPEHAAPVPSLVAPAVVVPVAPSAALAAVAPKLQITATESALPPGTDLPAGNGLLEIQVPDGTAIRVDGEYLGMGPGRRVPLPPGSHSLTLGEAAPQSVTITAGQRTLAVAAGPAAPAPAGSP
jgi:hypothetical protein